MMSALLYVECYRHSLMNLQKKLYSSGRFDGLTDLSYELNDVQLRPLYTWIHADLNGLSVCLSVHSSQRCCICRAGQCY